MATDFTEIYDIFLTQVDDYELGAISDDELDLVLNRYLLNGLLHIQEVSPELFNIVDTKNNVFKVNLSGQMKILISKAMKLEWVNEKLYSEELMRKSIGDRDYKDVNGTVYLKGIRETATNLRAEIREDLMRIAYSDDEIWEGFGSG